MVEDRSRKMKIRRRKLLSFVTVLCMMISFLSVFSYAEEEFVGDRWNIMLVIDGSASLWSGITSDPDELRYEAVDSFLDTLHTSGHKVGALVFTANQRPNDSDESMLSGIAVNTGMLDLDDAESRRTIKDSVRSATRIYADTPQTDIGTALYVAEQELAKVNGNGNRSAIFLFTDGEIDVKREHRDKSTENLHTAEQRMLDNDVLLCGVFLNKDGKYISSQIRDIVCAANGINGEGIGLGNYYVEITDAKSCAESTDKFMKFLGYSIPDSIAIPNEFESSFRIPGTGVEEANIRLRTDSAQRIPDGIEVSFTLPNGSTVPAAAVAACSGGRTYQVYKLIKPESGTWTVHVKVPDSNKISIYYSPVFSFYIGAGIEAGTSSADMAAGQAVEVTAYLKQNDTPIVDTAAYREYSCELVVKDLRTGEESRHAIVPDGNGKYTTLYTPTYGTFDVTANFYCDRLSVSTQALTWDLVNRAPSTSDLHIQTDYSFMHSGAKTYDLGEQFYDLEDGKNLQVEILDSSCDLAGISLDGSSLTVVGRDCGDGVMTLSAIDSQGASSTFKVEVSTVSKTFQYGMAILICLAILTLILFLLIRRKNKARPVGELTVGVSFTDSNDYEVELDGIDLSCPGTNGVPGKCTLSQLLGREMNDEYSALHNNFPEQKIRQLQEFIDANNKFLSSVKLMPKPTKYGGKTVTGIQISSSAGAEIIYNKNSSNIMERGTVIRFNYVVRDDSDPDIMDDDGFEPDPYEDDQILSMAEDDAFGADEWDD